MCFIPMNVHNGLFNGVRQLRCQHLSLVVSTFSISIGLLSSFFIKHCILPPSFSLVLSICLSVIPQPVFLISGLSLRFGDVGVFFLQSKVICRNRHIHYPENSSSDHFHTDAVVPSSDHCHTRRVLPPSDHYCIETVAPSGDHHGTDIVVPSSDHCCTKTVPPSSDHYGTTKVVPPSDHLHTKRKINCRKKHSPKVGGHGPVPPLWLCHCAAVVPFCLTRNAE